MGRQHDLGDVELFAGGGVKLVSLGLGGEGELSYSSKSGGVTFQAWADGLWQDAKTGGTGSKTVTAKGGAGGAGIGGGIYTTGTVYVHKGVVAGNKASTSNDDVFGVLIPF